MNFFDFHFICDDQPSLKQMMNACDHVRTGKAYGSSPDDKRRYSADISRNLSSRSSINNSTNCASNACHSASLNDNTARLLFGPINQTRRVPIVWKTEIHEP